MTTPVPREDLPGAPMVCVGDGPHFWTVHTGSRSVRRMSEDGGKTWSVVGVMWSAERARRETEAVEQHDIQVNLK